MKPMPEFTWDEYKSDSDSDSFSNNSEQECYLLENTVTLDDDNEDWKVSADMSSNKSKLCYSTSMTSDPDLKHYLNNEDSLSTVYLNSDLYKTAVEYNESNDTEDMEISSSYNGSNIVEDCTVYQEFKADRNNSLINEVDINETVNI